MALYAWAFWSVRRFRLVAVVINVMMFAATPIDGGHYVIDLIAGVAVAALAIMTARWMSRRLASSSPDEATETAVPDVGEGVPVSAAACTQSSP